jgi:hypothetical protein
MNFYLYQGIFFRLPPHQQTKLVLYYSKLKAILLMASFEAFLLAPLVRYCWHGLNRGIQKATIKSMIS